MNRNYNKEPESSTIKVYWILRKKIIEGDYSQDKKIVQSKLAKELNVSRTPVTKALHKLEMEGFVDNIPQRGFFIHKINLNEMIDLFMVRESLEMIATVNAAETATLDEIERMENFFSPFINNKATINVKEYRLADNKFHNYLLSLCKNNLVIKINESIQIISKISACGLLRDPQETIDEHLQIINAIKKRDPKLAKMIMMQHLEVTQKRMQKTKERLKKIGVDVLKIPIQELKIDENNGN